MYSLIVGRGGARLKNKEEQAKIKEKYRKISIIKMWVLKCPSLVTPVE